MVETLPAPAPAPAEALPADEPLPRGVKSSSAFRTISEVADDLDVAQHVLRFWESKFPQVRPLKRGGGRRYYRPEDIELLRQIRSLLYDEGYTIKGAQKLLRTRRARPGDPPVAAASPPPEAEPPRETPPARAPASPRAPARQSIPPLEPAPRRALPAELQRRLGALQEELRMLRELVRPFPG
jgi:DNA-binding transcriptional MerR regulator